MRIRVLLHDCFGGRGGIAKFNRDALTAMAAMEDVSGIEVLARLAPIDPVGAIPAKIRYRHAGGSLARYLAMVAAARLRAADLWLCGHLHLLPFAPPGSYLVVHGIEAWPAPSGGLRARLIRHALRRVARVISVSAVTVGRMSAWSGLPAARFSVVGNTVDVSAYAPAERAPAKPLLLSLGRMIESERYKGFDELLEVLPRLQATYPDLKLVLAGDGRDRARLEDKARALGVAHSVDFPGYVPESEKAALYRSATAFSLCGEGEGFGIVLLEAMASGLPVVASTRDASGEVLAAVGAGEAADPRDPDSLVAALERALARGPGAPPPGLATFAFPAFREKFQAALRQR